jgi:hypothetical protein
VNVIPFPGRHARQSTQPPRPGQALNATLAVCGLREDWKAIVRHRESVDPLGRRLAAYLTGRVPEEASARPLLEVCLEGAVHAWESERDAGQREERRFAALMAGLLAPLPTVLDWVVCTDDLRDPAWNPFEETLTAWWRRGAKTPRVFPRPAGPARAWHAVGPETFRLLVLSRFMVGRPVKLTPLLGVMDRIIGASG